MTVCFEIRVSHGSNGPMRDDREFQRIDVLIPCLVFCEDQIITGEISNISLSGALISQASGTPDEGFPVILALQRKQTIQFRATVDSKTIHSSQEVGGKDQINSFGVRFEESLKDVSNTLDFILDE